MNLTDRQQRIFRLVLEAYIKIGQPIGSEWVVSRVKPPISSATVRSELAALEQAGFLRSPHTSAGRVPTEEGYRLYIEEFARPEVVADREVQRVEHEIADAETSQEKVRAIARELSQLAGAVAIIGVDPRLLYATGMGQMMEAPEAEDVVVVRRITAALDRTDELLDELYDAARSSAGDEVRILIGTQNPIDENCSLLVTRVTTSEGDRLLALLGFMRMRYERNLALLHAMKKYIEREV